MEIVLDIVAIVLMCVSMFVFIVIDTKQSGIRGFFSSLVIAVVLFGWYFSSELFIGFSMAAMFVVVLIIGLVANFLYQVR